MIAPNRIALGAAAVALVLGADRGVAAQTPPDSDAEIIVTAQRAGVPVWRVSRGGATLVLFGTIDDIAKDTKWNAAALDRTIAQADRVMFPEIVGLSASPFQLVGWLAKWKRMAKLPRGQSLSAMITPGDRARLERLAAAGIAPRDWDRFHPLHLGQKMQDRIRAQAGKGEDPDAVVRRSARKHKIARAPIATAKASPIVKDLFASSPRDHVPCLRASLSFAEGGAAAIRARSAAWANRKVPEAANSPLDGVYSDCWPGTERPPATARGVLVASVERVLASAGGSVVAVFDLNSLADPGGLLDQLKRSGARIDGPAWR